ncbi:50S ribosomal protein L3 N(5)-glutamine methyltransferase [Blastochloris viridis]|uniref:50S ribosomal protein L3 glutamine methyltransferase n=1 Tax=Blastochloris viridis TaxID=1079 RepID=A0A0H5BBR7_BLAVI|nr:50S ribosomal protein L3 N(5)-glutamine methyltransferase [Blastochloris viridis]ALK08175.1 50S ribosomal protein L3 glutamine methyltransferase [Blastochloris viridis]BAR98559.1 protein-N(5)-glutamine methyltransferase PrmB [Blastochloris viridis]CUU44097.1 50S ribosomal protein L3 glutamine methyltransferase [Blastochloris viridis]
MVTDRTAAKIVSEHSDADQIAAAADDLLTVRDLLRYAVSRFNAAPLVFGHGTGTALDEAAFLILESLRLPIDDISPWLDARLTRSERARLLGLIETRVSTRTPAPYLVGRTYIQGVPFAVDPRVIIPRSFIGELLFRQDLFGPDGALIADVDAVERVLDLCTGSGCLAILAAHLFPNAIIDAVELSPEAAEVAAQNIEGSGFADRIALHRGDLFAPVNSQSYDLILTNPPYVDAEGMASLPLEALHEPRLALDGGSDGLDVVRRIIDQAADFLTASGALMCEVGRGRTAVEAAYPDLALLWLDTETSEGEVFWARAEDLAARGPRS